MAGVNTKRIEELATTALKSVLLRCQYIDSYIDSNDKTPSWDGNIFVYRNAEQKKSDLVGKVPVQVKGTEKRIVSDVATFSSSVIDLKNYYNDGGCIFFLVSVDPASGNHRIFYTSLLTVDLASILKKAEGKKTYVIKLNIFPENDENEMANIFMSFLQNKTKQMSFIGKKLLSLDELKESGVDIERISITTAGVGINAGNFERFITTHDFYVYAKVKGLDIEIPIEKGFNAVVSRKVDGTVCVGETEYYPSYAVVHEKGDPHIRIGKGICLLWSSGEKKATFQFTPTGTLSDFICDATFLVAVMEQKEITLNGINIRLGSLSDANIEKYRCGLEYFRKVKKTLELLGVTEELICDGLSDKDETALERLVKTVLYNQKVHLSAENLGSMYGALKIGNLSILVWAEKQTDGKYTIDSFFNERQVALFEASDIDCKHPIPASHYLILDKTAFEHTSNMDYEKVYKSVAKMEYSEYTIQQTGVMLLEMLKAFDAQKEKDFKLLDLAGRVCSWIEHGTSYVDTDVALLNKLQIAKRSRNLDVEEMVALASLRRTDKPAHIRCGANLLLGEAEKAQTCFEEMSLEEQCEFITYPICVFGDLASKPNTRSE